MANNNDIYGAILGGFIAGALAVARDEDLRYYRVSRYEWDRLSDRERAGKARSYARNILKTIRETPASLRNQREQAEKLLRQVRLAHSLDRNVVGFRAVSACEDLERKLRWEVGYLPVAVGPIDIG